MTDVTKPPAKRLPPAAGKGRPKGSLNRTTALLKDAVLLAAEEAGGKEGLVGFLKAQARKKNNGPFLALLGKVLPTQLTGDVDNPATLPGQVVEVRFVEAKGGQPA